MKKIIVWFLVVFMLLSLCACGNKDVSTGADGSTTSTETDKTSSNDVPTTYASFATTLDLKYQIIRNGETLDGRNVKTEDGAQKNAIDFPRDAIIEVTPDNDSTDLSGSIIVRTYGMIIECNTSDFKKLVINLAEKSVMLDGNDSDLEMIVSPANPYSGFGISVDDISDIEITGKGNMFFQTTGDGKTFRVKHAQAMQTYFEARGLKGMMDTTPMDKEYEIVITDYSPDGMYEYTYTKIS